MMWRSAEAIAGTVAALWLVSCVPARQAETGRSVPMFGGSPSRNMVNLVEKNVPDDFALRPKGNERNVKWMAALGSKAYGGPVIAGGRIFIGTNNDNPRDPNVKGDKGVVMCFDEKTGRFLWQIVHDKLDDKESDHPHEGVASAPCVDGDRLYYVSNRCELVCADVKGKVVWSLDMVKELKVFPGQLANSSPLVVGDLVYALTSHGVNVSTRKLPNPQAPALVAVNKTTGKVVWQDNRPGEKVMLGQWSNPTAATVGDVTQIIYAGGDGWLYGLEAKKGELLWKFDLNPKRVRKKPYRLGGGSEQNFVIATPVVYDGKCYVPVGQEPDTDGTGVGRLWCIDITRKPKGADKDLSPVEKTRMVKVGDEMKPIDDFDPADPANKDSGLVWHYGGYLTTDPKKRPKEEEHREWVFGRTISTVAVHDGLVYAAELGGFLHCVDAKTGKRVWLHDFEEGTWCSPYYVDGKVYIGTDPGELYIFKAGRAYNKPKQITVGQPVKMPPVACNGVLYVNGGTALYAVVAKGK